MTFLVMDGCDLYSAVSEITRRWSSTLNSGQMSVSSSGGRFGGGAIVLGGNLCGMQFDIGTTKTTLVAGLAHKFADPAASLNNSYVATGGNTNVIEFRNNFSTIMALGYDFARQSWVVLRGTTEIVAYYMPHGGNWHHIEFKILRNASTGTIDLKIDGVSVISLTNQNTGASDFNNVRIRSVSNSSAAEAARVDDIYITDSEAPGESRIQTLVPTSDTAQADFTPSTGMSHAAVTDELPTNNDTDYVASATLNHYDRMNMGDLTATVSAIHAVQHTAVFRGVAADSSQLRLKLLSGATTDDGTPASVATSYAFLQKIHATDPDTSMAWTESGVNALEAGFEITTANGTSVRVTGNYLEALVTKASINRVSAVAIEVLADVNNVSPPASGARPQLIITT